jgi:hypothetical protein
VIEESGFDSWQGKETKFGAHAASYTMKNAALSPEVKRPGREAVHSSPFSAKVKKDGAITPLSHTSSWLGT